MATAIAIFADEPGAATAARHLVQSGIPATHIHVHQKGNPPRNAGGIVVDEYLTGGFLTNFIGLLGGWLGTKQQPGTVVSYQDVFQHEGVVLSADADASEISQIETAMRSSGALKVTNAADIEAGRDMSSPLHDQWLLDEALTETFPASDPISPSSSHADKR